jgi:hypothetical protein
MEAIDAYQDRIYEWAMPDYRMLISGAPWSFTDAVVLHYRSDGAIDGLGESDVIRDHVTVVHPLRKILPPKVPDLALSPVHSG